MKCPDCGSRSGVDILYCHSRQGRLSLKKAFTMKPANSVVRYKLYEPRAGVDSVVNKLTHSDLYLLVLCQ